MQRLPLALTVLCLGVLLATGLRGIDYGQHWDERHLVKQAHQGIQRKLLLPRSYHYPSMSWWLTTAGLAMGEVPKTVVSPSLRPDGIKVPQPPAAPMAGDPILRVRALFLALSAFIVLWTFLAARCVVGPWPAALAAGVVGTSWEFAYHARWIAPDAVMAQFGALALFCLLKARTTQARGWLIAAAAAAALACGTKYTGGIFLFAVWWVAGRKVSALVLASAVFGAVYLLTTPGTVLDYGRFWHHLSYELTHYAKGHGSYSVPDASTHLGGMLRWMSTAALSPWAPVALGLAGLGVAGAAVAVRREHRFVLVGLPLLYLAFMAGQRVMIVRNYLVLLPFLAIWVALAAQEIAARLPGARWALAGVFALPMVAQAGWLLHAGESVADRRSDRFVQAFEGWAEGKSVWLAPKLAARARAAATPRDEAEYLAMYLSEGQPDARRWPTNGDRWFVRAFGPLEINLRWYGSWMGDDRIVVIPARDSARLELRL